MGCVVFAAKLSLLASCQLPAAPPEVFHKKRCCLLKLERYREDQHDPCAKMTRKFVKRSKFLKRSCKGNTVVTKYTQIDSQLDSIAIHLVSIFLSFLLLFFLFVFLLMLPSQISFLQSFDLSRTILRILTLIADQLKLCQQIVYFMKQSLQLATLLVVTFLL